MSLKINNGLTSLTFDLNQIISRQLLLPLVSLIAILWVVSLPLIGLANAQEPKDRGIKLEGASSYTWCDNQHMVVAWQPGGKETKSELNYLNISENHLAKNIDINLLTPAPTRIVDLHCKDQQITFFSYPWISSDEWSKGQKRSVLYKGGDVMPPDSIAQFKYPATSYQDKYILVNAFKFWGSGKIDENCAEKNTSKYKFYCWNIWNLRIWPLSKSVLTEYRWNEFIEWRDNEKKLQKTKNPEAPLVGADGHIIKSAFVLRDFSYKPIVILEQTLPYIASLIGAQVDPEETYVYTTCRRTDMPPRGISDRVCRYPLDGRKHEWEEVFVFDPDRKLIDDMNIDDLQIGPNGDVYFIVAGGRDKTAGIWKYDARTSKVVRITDPPDYWEDRRPKISPDGKYLAFSRKTREGFKLFIAPANGGRS